MDGGEQPASPLDGAEQAEQRGARQSTAGCGLAGGPSCQRAPSVMSATLRSLSAPFGCRHTCTRGVECWAVERRCGSVCRTPWMRTCTAARLQAAILLLLTPSVARVSPRCIRIPIRASVRALAAASASVASGPGSSSKGVVLVASDVYTCNLPWGAGQSHHPAPYAGFNSHIRAIAGPSAPAGVGVGASFNGPVLQHGPIELHVCVCVCVCPPLIHTWPRGGSRLLCTLCKSRRMWMQYVIK